MNATCELVSLSVSMMPAYDATATPAVTPGTISKPMPASARAASSSDARPKMHGSPPLRRTTILPTAAFSTSILLIWS